MAPEPTLEFFATRTLRKYVAATRPPFLLAALVAALIGLASAWHADAFTSPLAGVLTVIGAVLAHAGANVLNDYHDAISGTDAMNEQRLYPYTGGSRFIQNGVLTHGQTRAFGFAMFLACMLIGIILLLQAGAGLLWIGLLGLLVGWAYSAPPLSLNSRGLGELSVAAGFGLLIPLGADYVQREAFAALPLLAGLPYALLAANLLYINQFPDRAADEAAGKCHWVVRLGVNRARWGYLAIALLAYVLLTAEVLLGLLPAWVLLGLLTLPLSLLAAMELVRWADQPRRLAGAIQKTIAALLGHGLLVSLGLVLG